jgi:N-acetylmuramoyl-L-alanine amidase
VLREEFFSISPEVQKAMKKQIFITLIIIMILTSFVDILLTNGYADGMTQYYYDGQWHEYAYAPTYLKVNGESVNTDVPPLIFNDRSVVPARAVFEKLGAQVQWISEKQTVEISLDDTSIVLKMDDKIAIINDISYEMEIPSKNINSRIMIPVRFVGETLGMKVDWLPLTRVITLDTPHNEIDDKEQQTQRDENPDDDNSYNAIDTDRMRLNTIGYQLNNNDVRIMINTDSEIKEYSITELDNSPRLVIDLKDCILSAKETVIPVKYNNVLVVRTAQNSLSPDITRVVIDLHEWNEYSVELSKDKKNIYIDFVSEGSNITDVKFSNNGDDVLNIDMDFIQSPNIFRLSNPDRVVIDIPSSQLRFTEELLVPDSEIVKSVRCGQFTLNTTRIVADVKGQPEFMVAETIDGLKIEFMKPSYKNVYYSNTKQPQLVIGGNSIERNSIEETQEDNKYIISINDSDIDLGNGRLYINDNYIDFIDIETNRRTLSTDIIFYAKNVYGYSLNNQNDDKIIIDVIPVSIEDKYSQHPSSKGKIVVIDPGHGGKDPGAVFREEGNSKLLKESDLNLAICLALYDMLREKGVNVYMTRYDDSFVELKDIAEFANNLEAHLFVSVHNNAIANNPDYDGTMTLYYPLSNSEAYGITSEGLAKILQEEMVNGLGTTDRGLSERPNLAVLNRTKMPAVIAEVAFITNPSDRAKLKTKNFLDKAAESICEGIMRALNESTLDF